MKSKRQRGEKKETPKQYFLGGVFLLCCAVAAYFYIGNAEQTGHSFTLPIILDPVYRLIGKWGIVGVVALAGVVSLWVAIDMKRTQGRTPVEPEPAPSASTSGLPPV
jgi:hypothetical protein